jgi:hypothetical protein
MIGMFSLFCSSIGAETRSSDAQKSLSPQATLEPNRKRDDPRLSAPGQFEVDEESAQRALERTLVQTGALLLQAGQVDLETRLNFARNQQSIPIFFPPIEPNFLSTEERRDSILSLNLQMRIGLPFESQLELGIPYQYLDRSTVTRVGYQIASQTSDSHASAGDVTLAIAKTLWHEKGRHPDLIARFRWDTDTGGNGNPEALKAGSGYNEYTTSLTVTKRQDPLIFTGNLSYQYTEKERGVQPGKTIGLSIGTVLAASPETSLRLVLNQSFVSETKANQQKIFGSDHVIGSLLIGASSVLDNRNFLNVSVDIGLSDEASDYSLNIAYTRRFSGIFSHKKSAK